MKYLITGAAGFIGSHLCNKLAIEGNEVVAIDNFSDYYDVNLKTLRVERLLTPLSVKVLRVDISDFQAIDELMVSSKPQVVINLAAQAGVRLPTEQVHRYVNSNLVGFSNILQSTVSNNVPYFLYASSSSVYGDQAKVPYNEKEKNLNPISFYGATKLTNELLTPTLLKNSVTRARGLRFFTVYGPWGRPDMAYFRMIANVLSGSEFTLYGDGSAQRDFTYIGDVINLVSLLTKDLTGRASGFNDVVNLGGGKPYSILDLVELITNLSGNKIEFKASVADIKDAKKTQSDWTYLKMLTDSKPNISIENGMLQTIDWAKSSEILPMLNHWISNSFKYSTNT